MGIKTCIGDKVRNETHANTKALEKTQSQPYPEISSEGQRSGEATPLTHASTVLKQLLRKQFGEARQHAAWGDRIISDAAHSSNKRIDRSFHVPPGVLLTILTRLTAHASLFQGGEIPRTYFGAKGKSQVNLFHA